MNPAAIPFPPVETATKLLVALGIGLLVGLEREWSHKDLGVRTFAIVTLLGMLAALLSPAFVLVGLAGVVVLTIIANTGNLMERQPLEVTTSAAILVVYALGVMVGEGHVFTPTASAIVMTLLLATKSQFERFAVGLTEAEVRGAVLLGLIGFVVYPVLPDRFIDTWDLVNPREAWLTVIFIAAISFGNYVLLRIYGTRGLYYAAIFGGLVNSTATMARLSESVRSAGDKGATLGLNLSLLTMVSMLLRNLAVLGAVNPQAGLIALGPILLMAAASAAFVWWHWREESLPPSELGSPFHVGAIATFGALFLLIQIVTVLGERFLGSPGAILASVVGGFASSASTTAAAANLALHDRITEDTAAISTVLASLASTVTNLPILYRETRDRSLLKRLILATVLIAALGLLSLGGVQLLRT